MIRTVKRSDVLYVEPVGGIGADASSESLDALRADNARRAAAGIGADGWAYANPRGVSFGVYGATASGDPRDLPRSAGAALGAGLRGFGGALLGPLLLPAAAVVVVLLLLRK
jgi:hypothetical protein